MSVDNLDGNGLADQPSIIYGFDETATTGGLPGAAQALLDDTHVEHTDSEDIEIRELSRSGFGSVGPSPGDVIERDSTKSTLDTRLPRLNLPGQDGLNRDDCGENKPAFACLDAADDGDEGCGKPVYVGRTCANPTCSRCWAAAVKDKVLRLAGNLDAYARILHKRTGEAIHQNHVVASLPGILVDSEMPLDRIYEILKTILKHKWGIKGFAAIYHPYRIKKEYREDQYSHGGADGEGDMTWKDVLNSDNPMQYLKFEPHFHLFFPGTEAQFKYSVVPGVFEESGWVFHRIEKSDTEKAKSVEDLNDLVLQITYCLSHAGVNDWHADRDEFTTRMKGELATDVEYVPQQIKDQALAAFCDDDCAKLLLGVGFVNMNEAECRAEVSAHSDQAHVVDADDGDDADDIPADHPLHDVWNPGAGIPAASTGDGDPFSSNALDAGVPLAESDGEAGRGSATSMASEPDSVALAAFETTPDSDGGDGDGSVEEPESPVVDAREQCGGVVKPIWQAESRLDDSEWCQQAEHVSGLREAFAEWERLTSGDEDLPWTGGDPDGAEVVRDLD